MGLGFSVVLMLSLGSGCGPERQFADPLGGSAGESGDDSASGGQGWGGASLEASGGARMRRPGLPSGGSGTGGSGAVGSGGAGFIGADGGSTSSGSSTSTGGSTSSGGSTSTGGSMSCDSSDCEEKTLSIVTDSLPDGTAEESYSATIEVEGGTEPYYFALVDVSSELDWLSIGTNGVLTGTPQQVLDSPASLVVMVTDAGDQGTRQSYELAVHSCSDGEELSCFTGIGGDRCATGTADCENGSAGECVADGLSAELAHCGPNCQECPAERADQCVDGQCMCGEEALCAEDETCCGEGDSATCAKLSDDVQNCGACGNACQAPSSDETPVCVGGTCATQCVPSATRCEGGELLECGGDGDWQPAMSCTYGCSGSVCAECSSGDTRCNGGREVCDSSGHWKPSACGTGMECVSDGECRISCGATTCAEDEVCCGEGDQEQCVDIQGDDVQNCGACGNACQAPSSDETPVCVGGTCATQCMPSATRCEGGELLECGGDGDWQPAMSCTYGCSGSVCAECSSGDTRCNGGREVCDSSGHWKPSACGSGTECVSGGQCKKSARQPCSSDGECASGDCNDYFYDNDGDGYTGTPVSYCSEPPNTSDYTSTDENDCCDVDERAYPGQSEGFADDRDGCGGYDFNCDEKETRLITGPIAQCSTGTSEGCGRSNGWWPDVPSCGQSESWKDGGVCDQDGDQYCPDTSSLETRSQLCR